MVGLGLDPRNYGLEYDWSKYGVTPPSGDGAVGTLSRLGQSAQGGIPFGPIGAGAGLLVGAIGEGMRGAKEDELNRAAEEKWKKQFDFQKQQAGREQFNTERGAGMQGLGYLDTMRSNANRNRALLKSDLLRLGL